MNPASLKANLKWAKIGGTIIVDADSFDERSIEKAGYKTNPMDDGSLDKYNLIKAPVSSFTKESIKELTTDVKTAEKSRNMFALGIIYLFFDRKFDTTFEYLDKKFKKNPLVSEINKTVMKAGYIFAENVDALESQIHIPKSTLEKGKYRNITGNVATAWGLLAASEKSGVPLFLGSYPITPATEY